MISKVLYLQPSAEIAAKVEERFSDCKNEIEFEVVSSAVEAVKMLDQDDYTVLIADSFITDMKLLELVMKVEKQFPNVVMNVCVDLTDSKLVPAIANMRNVVKVYLYPWEIDNLVEGVKVSIDVARIRRDFAKRKSLLAKEQTDFEATLISLKETMHRQRYSYHKLKAVLNPFLDGTFEQIEWPDGTIPEQTDALEKFVRQCCEKMLLLMTTSKIDAAGFEKNFVSDVSSDLNAAGSIAIKSFENSITDMATRDKLAAVWFVLWMVVMSQKEQYTDAVISISSKSVSTSKCRFVITVQGTGKQIHNEMIEDYVKNIAETFTDAFGHDKAEENKYIIDFDI